jgi:dihydrofolate synthase/folylpolyglutamate synthase
VNFSLAIHYLENLTRTRGIRPGLDRSLQLLARLGDPQNSYSTIHVAGTNGKGTVTRMLSTAFRYCGYRTGEYTSPHLISYRERFQINGKEIAPREFAALFSKVWSIARTIPGLTEFEVLTAMAFEYFRRHKVEIAVLETGLGGRFDATNVVTPLCSVITSIGHDHQDLLGHTLKKIAFEKSGIIKPGRPVIIGELPDEAEKEICRIARLKKSPLIQARRHTAPFKTTMAGVQQKINIGMVMAVREVLLKRDSLTKGLSQSRFVNGIKKAYLPGRFQIIRKKNKPLLILDGGHNEEAARMLAANLKNSYPKKKKTFIIGMLKRKDANTFLKYIVPVADNIVLTAPTPEYHSVQELAKAIKRHSGTRIVPCPGLKKAWTLANKLTPVGGVICIAGSFYLVGEFQEQISP